MNHCNDMDVKWMILWFCFPMHSLFSWWLVWRFVQGVDVHNALIVCAAMRRKPLDLRLLFSRLRFVPTAKIIVCHRAIHLRLKACMCFFFFRSFLLTAILSNYSDREVNLWTLFGDCSGKVQQGNRKKKCNWKKIFSETSSCVFFVLKTAHQETF